MPIEFRCSDCDKLLRTPDETAGRQAKCPECGALMQVPEAPAIGSAPPQEPASPYADGFPPPAPSTDPDNPYASPGEYMMGHPRQGDARGSITPTRIDLGDVLARTWQILTDQFGISIGVAVVYFLLCMAINIPLSIVGQVAITLSDNFAVGMMANFFTQVIGGLFNIWLDIGMVICFLKIARGRQVQLGEIFAGGRYFVNVLSASVLVGLMVGGVVLVCALVAGALAAVLAMQGGAPAGFVIVMIATYAVAGVPVIVLLLMFSMHKYLIIDQNVGILESLSLSMQITRGNKLSMFLMFMLVSILGGLFVLLTCGVGIVVLAPFGMLLFVVTYLTMTGQPTAADRPAVPQEPFNSPQEF